MEIIDFTIGEGAVATVKKIKIGENIFAIK